MTPTVGPLDDTAILDRMTTLLNDYILSAVDDNGAITVKLMPIRTGVGSQGWMVSGIDLRDAFRRVILATEAIQRDAASPL